MKQEQGNDKYRPNVGMVVVNRKGQVLLCRRIDVRFGGWQMPQGGIDEGEDPERAALRELREEIGTDNVDVLGQTKDWFKYEVPTGVARKTWPKEYVGQRQKWFLMRFMGDDTEIKVDGRHAEFDSWSWVPPNRVVEFAVDFKRDTYEKVLTEFQPLLQQ